MPLETPEPLPFNLELEQGLIGAVMVNNDAYSKVASIVTKASFHEPIHAHIWGLIEQMIGAGKLATPVTLKSFVGDADLGNGQTPMQYLARLAAEATTVINAPDYARDLRDLHIRRRIIAISNSAKAISNELPPDMKVTDLISDLSRDLDALIPSAGGDASVFEAFGRIDTTDVQDAHRDQRGVTGLSTGYERLDEITNGLVPGNFIVIAGRPAMGKTALATGIAKNVAMSEREKRKAGGKADPVAFFSIEMPAHQLKKRVLSDVAGVMMRKLMRGEGDNKEMEAFIDAERDMKDLPLYIDQTGTINIAQLKMKARRFKKLHGMSLLVIDYLQLIHGTNKGRNDNRVQEVTEITTGLRELAKELNVPVIGLSQLSRKVEDREDKRPMLMDLRESGSIEQDADIVLFVYREEYYLRKAEPRDEGEKLEAWNKKIERWKGIAEIICAKNRHGGEATAEIGWEGWLTRFTPEPPERRIEPEEARKTARRIALTDDGKAFKEILMELSVTVPIRPDAELMACNPRLHRQAQLVNRDEVRRLFKTRIVPDLDEKAQNSRLQKAADNLRIAGLTSIATGPQKQPYVYLIELIPSE